MKSHCGCYWPFWVGPRQKSSFPASYEPIERGQKKREVLFSDQRTERCELPLCSTLSRWQAGGGRGCFIGIPQRGRGTEFSRGRCSCAFRAPDRSAHGLPRPSWTRCRAWLLRTDPKLRCRHGARNSGLKDLRCGFCTRHPVSKWN